MLSFAIFLNNNTDQLDDINYSKLIDSKLQTFSDKLENVKGNISDKLKKYREQY